MRVQVERGYEGPEGMKVQVERDRMGAQRLGGLKVQMVRECEGPNVGWDNGTS